MDRREFLAVAAALPLSSVIGTPQIAFPPIAGEQPGCVFFDNLSTLDWSSVDGSVRYYDWVGNLLGEWRPGDDNYESILDFFVQFPLPRVNEKTADTCEASAAQY